MEKVFYTPLEAANWLGIDMSVMYWLIRGGWIKDSTFSVPRALSEPIEKTVIHVDDLKEFATNPPASIFVRGK